MTTKELVIHDSSMLDAHSSTAMPYSICENLRVEVPTDVPGYVKPCSHAVHTKAGINARGEKERPTLSWTLRSALRLGGDSQVPVVLCLECLSARLGIFGSIHEDGTTHLRPKQEVAMPVLGADMKVVNNWISRRK